MIRMPYVPILWESFHVNVTMAIPETVSIVLVSLRRNMVNCSIILIFATSHIFVNILRTKCAPERIFFFFKKFNENFLWLEFCTLNCYFCFIIILICMSARQTFVLLSPFYNSLPDFPYPRCSMPLYLTSKYRKGRMDSDKQIYL